MNLLSELEGYDSQYHELCSRRWVMGLVDASQPSQTSGFLYSYVKQVKTFRHMWRPKHINETAIVFTFFIDVFVKSFQHLWLPKYINEIGKDILPPAASSIQQ